MVVVVVWAAVHASLGAKVSQNKSQPGPQWAYGAFLLFKISIGDDEQELLHQHCILLRGPNRNANTAFAMHLSAPIPNHYSPLGHGRVYCSKK